MLVSLIGARFHGWLDDLVVATYLAVAYLLHLHGVPLFVVLGGATVHFLLARFTDYPQGALKLLPFRVHAFIELAEGVAVMGIGFLVTEGAPVERVALVLLGASQFGAFAFSDYAWPKSDRPLAA